jgi:two-component system, NtrC family, sensor kinase
VSDLEPIRRFLEGSVDGAVILDRDRRILSYNRAYANASGLRGPKLRQRVADGARCYEIFPLEICASACVGCDARALGKALRVDEIRAAPGGEDARTFIVTAFPLGDYLIESYRDVTADVRIQRRLKVLLARERDAKAELQREVEAQTRELRKAQAQLVHHEKMSSLGRLVAGIAHELNNPINFVYGNVEFLGNYLDDLRGLVELVDAADELPRELRERLDRAKREVEYDFLVDDARQLIRSIRTGAERTAAIVRDLKTFSRAGAVELHEADIAQTIDASLTLVAPLLGDRIRVVRRYASELPSLVCNAGHLSQVFMNILTNAAQAIEGEGVIRITAEPSSGDAVSVAITDSGPGIDESILDAITDPFFTTKDVGEGTGLGLWISESIVRAHGGELRIRNEPAGGATFEVIVPRHPSEAKGARGDQRDEA